MSGHLLLFGADTGKPAAAINGGVGELRFPPTDRFPGALLTYRDLAGVDDLIAAAVELRAMLGDAQARADRVARAAAEVLADPAYQAEAERSRQAIESGDFTGYVPLDLEPCTCIEGNDETLVTTSVEGCPQHGCGDLDALPQCKPGWQAAMNAELSEKALAAEVPLGSLAPEPQEDEAET